MGCENGICATYTPPDPISDEVLYGEWWFAQTFKSKLAGEDVDCDIIRASWWMNSHAYEGLVYAAIRAVDVNGRPTGGNLSTGSYYQPEVTPDMPPVEKQFEMTEFKLLARTQYALLLWLDGGDKDHFMYAECSQMLMGAYPDGGYVFSWDYGVTWSDVEPTKDWHFEVYGCIYSAVAAVAGKGLVAWTP